MTQTSFLFMNRFNRTARSLEGLIFQRSDDTFICNSKRVALMIRKLVLRLRATDTTTCSSIQEKKISCSFGFFDTPYNKKLQEARPLYRIRFRSTSLKPKGGYRPVNQPMV